MTRRGYWTGRRGGALFGVLRGVLVGALVAATVPGIAGCASTEFRVVDNGRTVRGNGGTPIQVDGMDVWIGSAPARAHRVIGYVDDDRAAVLWPMARRLPDIVQLARRAGGQGVVIDGAGSQTIDTGSHYGQHSVFDSGYAEAGSIGSTSAGQTYQASAVVRNQTRAAVIRFDP